MADRILVVDDDATTLDAVTLGLEGMGYAVVACRTAAEAAAILSGEQGEELALMLSDLQIGGDSGLDLSAHAKLVRPQLPIIIMTGHASVKTAVEAMRGGVWDYLVKPVSFDELELQTRRAIEHARLTHEVRRLRREAVASSDGELIGASPAIRELKELIRRVAATEVGVLLLGESGTGKEVVAQTIHRQSARGDGPFVAINCAALPETLLESELFGHARGAFTDAKKARRGLFLDANGGTLFLDEIAEMPMAMQPKLLRALQERVVRAVGGDQSVPFDTRVIAATNRDLSQATADGTFREDLYYRLNVVQIDLPPLRARGNDILLLAQSFLERFAARHKVDVRGISPEAAEKLVLHSWPGNVRELMNAIERGVALSRTDTLQVADLPERIREAEKKRIDFVSEDPDDFVTLDELERRYVQKVVGAVGGNKSQAARILGVDRKTLFRKLKREDQGAAPGAAEPGDD
ncbi:MAG: sigma-54 dependent transcriptional regulator [Myxococcota bacterium]